MSTRAIHEHLEIVKVPIPYAEDAGRSKLNVVRDGVRFTNAIVWTALAYNPVRVIGAVGLLFGGLAFLIGVARVVARLSGSATLSAPGDYSTSTRRIRTASSAARVPETNAGNRTRDGYVYIPICKL